MTRQFNVSHETMVSVKGGDITSITELGLPLNEIKITPHFSHKDIYVDDFGDEVPAEILSKLMWVDVGMVLMHYDAVVLGVCIARSIGAHAVGLCGPAGIPLFARNFGLRLYLLPTN